MLYLSCLQHVAEEAPHESPVVTRQGTGYALELQEELKGQELEPDVRHESNRNVWILIRLEAGAATPLSASGLAKRIKAVLER